MKQQILVASSNTGIGLWTSICVALCSLFGKESKNYKKKQTKVLNRANEDLNEKLRQLGRGYHLVDYRVTWSHSLAVTVSALAVYEPVEGEEEPIELERRCPQCGALVDEDTVFCGECGAKVK